MHLYLAGADAWADTLMDLGVKYQLMSYFYLRGCLKTGKGRTLLARMRKAVERGYCFMLDSGAFTYQQKAKTSHNLPKPALYWQEYKDFVETYADLFKVVVEFDIDLDFVDPETGKPLETQKVNEWTNQLLQNHDIRAKVMPVWKKARGQRWIEDWLKDPASPLVGISSGATGKAGEIQGIIGLCHRWGKFVHGFGQTRIKTDMKFTSWDSVDSTTWLRADKYGGTNIFYQNKFIVLDHLHKKDRALYREYYKMWGLDFAAIMREDLEENRKANIIAWRELANDFERKARNERPPYLYRMFQDGEGYDLAEHPRVTIERLKKEAGGAQT